MSTWQIFSDAGTNVRWEVSGQILHTKPADEPNGALSCPSRSTACLPSMADLLRQGYSKLLERGDEGVRNAPMFRTGLGKSVVLKQSSIAKALSVLGDDDDHDLGETFARDNGYGFSNSLFCTGSGKSVNLSSAGLTRAKMLLEMEDDDLGFNFQAFQHPRESSAENEQYGRQNLFYTEMKEGMENGGVVDNARPSIVSTTSSVGGKVINGVSSNILESEMHNSDPKPPPIKFHTAGGRSLSVSSDALERAKSLLGDPDLGTPLSEEDAADPSFTDFRVSRFRDASSNKENDFYSAFTYPTATKSKHNSKTFISPLKSSSRRIHSSFGSDSIISGSSLIKKFDEAVDNTVCGLNSVPRMNSYRRSSNSHGPLVDISNTIGTNFSNNRLATNDKRRLGRGSSVSPFKRPRSSKFTTPLNKNALITPSGLSTSSSETSCYRKGVTSKYPFQVQRMYIKEYFKLPVLDKNKKEHATIQVRRIKPSTAEKYMFANASGLNCIGAEAFYNMLVESGASVQHVSREWVANHYKWIVWKLACYERYMAVKSAANFLTVPNVLEELKYRYEREVNHGHRSAIKRILEGDLLPSSMLVLCISAVCVRCKPETEASPEALTEAYTSDTTKVELTDGWYSVDATLDIPLSKYLATGKLFVGQKLRIWGAGLCSWVGPISPLEASRTISLSLHINGTYRAHWADRLGLCRDVGPPLAFTCIKSNGGPVPQTLVGVTRVYPVLYKEKLSNGGTIVRSERMESKLSQFHNQRCTAVIEDIASEFQRGAKDSHILHDSDSEGAKILKILETSAEPEVIMAEMNPEQLNSFASYQAKLEARRQLDMEKAIQKALRDAGLLEREVIPFMRVRVVGLTKEKDSPKEGLITLWNPTEKQLSELVEGQAYAVAGLLPMNSDPKTLYLQARGSSSNWQRLSHLAIQHFQPFFSPRVSMSLSNLDEVPLCSEFDIAALVLHVGEVYTAAQQKKQWVFVTDGSLQSEEISDSLLAISFCSSNIDDESFLPINYNLAESIVGFCNLIKKRKDQINNLWIADATENSMYTFAFDSPNCSHLRSSAATAKSWAKTSRSTINKLKEKVVFIIGDCKD